MMYLCFNFVDCVFILHTIIRNILASMKQLYCAFIDYQRCFDTVIHEALWQKLVQLGISSKYINIVKSIYNRISSCTRYNSSELSALFDIAIGPKQGEPLSSLIFILFVNDFATILILIVLLIMT